MATYKIVDADVFIDMNPFRKLKIMLGSIDGPEGPLPIIYFHHDSCHFRNFHKLFHTPVKILSLSAAFSSDNWLQSYVQGHCQIFQIAQLRTVTYRQIMDEIMAILMTFRMNHTPAELEASLQDGRFMDRLFHHLAITFSPKASPRKASEIHLGDIIQAISDQTDTPMSPEIQKYLEDQGLL